MNPFYTDYSEYLSRFFGDTKVQKISINSGSGCPNRDGTLGKGGCIYCDNTAFTPAYCFGADSIIEQIEAGKKFFSRKYPDMKYLGYLQSYTSTYRSTPGELQEMYDCILAQKDIVGLIIGTRPDCISEEMIKIFERLNKRAVIFVELGVETSHDSTLKLINRGHSWAQSETCIRKLVSAGIHTGVHLIAGLPGESEEMVLETVKRSVEAGVESIKMHHLQVLKGTPLHRMWQSEEIEVNPFSLEEYLDFCVKVINAVPRKIAIERFLASAPPSKVVAPKWGIKNYEFTNLLINKLRKI